MTFSVTILGNNAALPAKGRHPTAQVVNHDQQYYLLDCGEDTQSRIRKNKIKPGRLDFVFISHLHGDHYFGLIGLITSLHLNQRDKSLTIYGPKGLDEIIHLQLKYSDTHLGYDLIFIEVNTESHYRIFENEKLEVFTIPMKHRISCCGYLFKEKPGQRRINIDVVNYYKVPISSYTKLKEGEDYMSENGDIIKNEIMTFPPHTPRTYAFCSDTVFTKDYIEIIHKADMIYHESTFLKADEVRAFERFHCTAEQAAIIAKEANVKKLLLGHFSSKYIETDLFEIEAKGIFNNSVVTEEGRSYDVLNNEE